MKTAIVMILAALLTSSASIPGVNLTEGSGTATDTHTDEPEREAIFEVYEDEEGQKYENEYVISDQQQSFDDNTLILMTTEDCTDEQLAKILEKYHLTLLRKGKIIPYCTVQLEENLTEAELQELADTIMNEDGIESAMISYISIIS